MTTESRQIAVVGAGIAGLTVAAAISRGGGDCVVFEQAAYIDEVGAGIQLSPNAVRLLHRLGLGRHLDRVAVRPLCIEMRRWDDGAVLQRLPLGAECERRYGAPYLTLHRADLHQGLMELVPPGAVRLALRCHGVTPRPDGVDLHFDSGNARADLVIGADGIHSVVRAAVVEDRPRFSGQVIYRGLIPADRLPELVAEPKVRLWLGPGRHCVAYPVSSGRQISFGATIASDWHTESWSAPGRPADLLAAYQDWHPEVRRLLAAADSVRRWALHDRDTAVHRGGPRLALIGDAAHPMLPFFAQGANQAVEDSAVLAACLCGPGGDDLAGVLERYDRLRAPRTAEVHRRSRANSGILHRADPGGPDLAELSQQDWLYGYDALAELTTSTVAD